MVKFGEGGSPAIVVVGIGGGGVEVPRSLSGGLFVLPSIAERMEYSKFAPSDPKDEPKEEKAGDIEYEEFGSKGEVYVVVVNGNIGETGAAYGSAGSSKAMH